MGIIIITGAELSFFPPHVFRSGIEPKTGLNPISKTVLNVFCMYKTDFFLPLEM